MCVNSFMVSAHYPIGGAITAYDVRNEFRVFTQIIILSHVFLGSRADAANCAIRGRGDDFRTGVSENNLTGNERCAMQWIPSYVLRRLCVRFDSQICRKDVSAFTTLYISKLYDMRRSSIIIVIYRKK